MDGSEIASLVCLGVLEVGMLYLCIRKLSRPQPAPLPDVDPEESRSRQSTVVYLELDEA
jgi:hypothetical protein